jgi:tripartite-type tricarboxylate transporter receptor subunit TctC
MWNRRQFTLSAAAAACAVPGSVSFAAEYPDRPIRLAVGFPAGGTADLLARLIADSLRPRIGQPVVVENRTGASTLLSGEYVARQPADGHTLVLIGNSMVSGQVTMKSPPVQALRELTLVAPVCLTEMVFIVSPMVTETGFPELLRSMKARPSQFKYASYGMSSTNRLVMLELLKAQGIEALHVPYNNGPQMLADLMRGEVHMIFDTMQQALPFIQSNRVRALAVGTPKRSVSLPSVPTLAELVRPGFEYAPFWGIAGPANLPPAIAARLAREVNGMLGDADFVRKLEGLFMVPHAGDAAALRKLADETLRQYQDAVRSGLIEVT